MYGSVRLEQGDTFAQKIHLSRIGPTAMVTVNGDDYMIVADDPDLLEAFGEVLLEAGRDLEMSLADHAAHIEAELNALRDAS